MTDGVNETEIVPAVGAGLKADGFDAELKLVKLTSSAAPLWYVAVIVILILPP